MGKIICAAFLLLFIAFPAFAGSSYYVAKSGSDSYSCSQAMSASTPKSTIASGLTCLVAGDTLIINDAGVYNESIDCAYQRCPSGTVNANTVIRGGSSANRPVITPVSGTFGVRFWDNSYVTLQDVRINANNVSSAAVFSDGYTGSHHITVRNVEIYNVLAYDTGAISSDYKGHDFSYINNQIHTFKPTGGGVGNGGIYVNTYNTMVDGNVIDGATWWGIQVYRGGTTPTPDNAIIRNNLIKNCGRTSHPAISVTEGSNSVVYNNIVVGNGYGLFTRARSVKFWNNTVVGNTYPSNFVNGSGEVRNNIFADFIPEWGSGFAQSNNLMPGTSARFVNQSGGDYHLTTGSPAIEAGLIISSVTTDKDGVPRPSNAPYDLGAYQFGTGGELIPPQNLRITVITQ